MEGFERTLYTIKFDHGELEKLRDMATESFQRTLNDSATTDKFADELIGIVNHLIGDPKFAN